MRAATILFFSTGVFALVAFMAIEYQKNIKSEPADERVFVYATLMNPFVRFYACRCRVSSEPAVLTGYRREGRNIVLDPGSTVPGLLLTVTEVELARFDRYEQVPERYVRERVLIEESEAWVYRRAQ